MNQVPEAKEGEFDDIKEVELKADNEAADVA